MIIRIDDGLSPEHALPAQSLGIAQDLIEPLGDDLPAVLLPLVDQVLELLDLVLEPLDLVLMAFLPEVELLFQDLAQLGLDLGPVLASLRLAQLPASSSASSRRFASSAFIGWNITVVV